MSSKQGRILPRILPRIARAAFTGALAYALAAPARPAEAKVFVTLAEALASAFPAERKCVTASETKYLTPAQLKQAQELAGPSGGGAALSALVVRYAARCDGKPAGHAYTDTHRVRTHPETLLIVVGPAGKVAQVEALSFDEPLEYIPRAEWYGTFKDAPLDAELAIKRRIPFVTGASLTSQATLAATRRALAVDRVLGAAATQAAEIKTETKTKK